MNRTQQKTRTNGGDSLLKTTTWGRRLALLTLLALLVAHLALANGKHKVSADLDALKGGNHGATVDVIIQFNQTPTAAHHQKVQNKGGVLKTKLDFIKAAHYSVPVDALDSLAEDPDVAYISPDRKVTGSLDHVVAAVNAGIAQAGGWDGTGIGVAIIDSGIHNLNDFNPGPGQNRIVITRILPVAVDLRLTTFTAMERTSLESLVAEARARLARVAFVRSRESRQTST